MNPLPTADVSLRRGEKWTSDVALFLLVQNTKFDTTRKFAFRIIFKIYNGKCVPPLILRIIIDVYCSHEALTGENALTTTLIRIFIYCNVFLFFMFSKVPLLNL